ncbi:response regulator [Pseudomonas sp. 148P]|uniref:Response regulator n=1 Tax=Pseudomonas ulcerans TaxID=3115852 RepID=A0ABU7HQ67_9PSED|nr:MULTISPECIES: response regulator [unclassified Pseudomonas]MEE1922710.1 response regulator [Pseudomonas sp. 147P]MEE1933687.1 response regulator [Pseudomonas sp. 148P]
MSTVLVVDDEYVISDILAFALEDAGYQVEKAGNGEKALEVLNKTRVELLITDYMMPTMNGEELARTLREDPQFKTLPIILMSGAQGSIGRQNPGLFDEVLDKPFDPETLIAMVRRLMPSPGG